MLSIKDQNLVNLILKMYWHDSKEGPHTYAFKTYSHEYNQAWMNKFTIETELLEYFQYRQRKVVEDDKTSAE